MKYYELMGTCLKNTPGYYFLSLDILIDVHIWKIFQNKSKEKKINVPIHFIHNYTRDY